MKGCRRRLGQAMAAMVLVAGMRGLAAAEIFEAPEPVIAADRPLQSDPILAGADRFEQGAKEVTEVNLDKTMLAMAAKFLGNDDADAKRLMSKMDFVYVRSYEYAKAGQYRMEDLAQFRRRLDESKWSHLVKNRSETESNDVWIRMDDEGQFSELMVIAAEPTQLSFVHLKGRMSVDDLIKAGAKYGVPQMSGAHTPKGVK